ncbi:MAG: alpha/beta hydrolase [Hyphomonadaceae bacterium]|nr:alpha/beta hydrolase [Hyphomonadaceae bacterium]
MSAAPELRNERFAERTVRTADGLSIRVRDYPAIEPATGLPVFCLHGLTRNSKDFELVAPRIAALGRRTLAWDTRGRGASDRDADPARYNPMVYAQDLIAALDEMAVERAVFIGTSMGGLITMTLAALAPQRIAAAVLNDVGPVLDPAGLARIGGYVGATGKVATWEEAAERVRGVNAVAFPHADQDFWARFARRVFRQNPDGSIELDYDPAISLAFKPTEDGAAPAPPDMKPIFQALAAAGPVLVVRGAVSDLLAPEGVLAMRALDEDLESVEVPNVGHAPTLEEPAAWDAVLNFLARVP